MSPNSSSVMPVPLSQHPQPIIQMQLTAEESNHENCFGKKETMDASIQTEDSSMQSEGH